MMKDGKPNLVTYDLREGTYIIPKIMDSGYVELGKKRDRNSRARDHPHDREHLATSTSRKPSQRCAATWWRRA